jgi:hypothetical protein
MKINTVFPRIDPEMSRDNPHRGIPKVFEKPRQRSSCA